MRVNQQDPRVTITVMPGGRRVCALATWSVVMLLAVMFISPAGAWAQETAELSPPLDLPLLDGVEEPPEPEAAPEEAPPEEPPAAPGSIEEIAQQMQQVEGRLRAADSGETTQAMQRQIVDALGEFIEQLRNSQGQESGSSQGAGSQPQENPQASDPEEPPEDEEPPPAAETPQDNAEDREDAEESEERSGHRPGEGPEDILSREDLLREAWGHLPGRAGHEMPNAATERFLPEFERQIEEYFRRLAEEPPADAL